MMVRDAARYSLDRCSEMCFYLHRIMSMHMIDRTARVKGLHASEFGDLDLCLGASETYWMDTRSCRNVLAGASHDVSYCFMISPGGHGSLNRFPPPVHPRHLRHRTSLPPLDGKGPAIHHIHVLQRTQGWWALGMPIFCIEGEHQRNYIFSK